MKIIEILNKIANGEEIPKKIKYLNRIYEYKYTTYGTGYLYEDKGIKYWFSEDALSDSAEELNYEVEIIEDEEEIDIQRIKIKNISYVLCDKDFDNNMVTDIFNSFFRENQECIDTLAQAVKQLDKNIKELR